MISISLGLKISAQKSTDAVTNTQTQQVEIPADFPAYNETGKTTDDDHNFQLSVRQWIKTHPDEYLDFMNKGVDILQFRNKNNISTVDANQLPENKKKDVSTNQNSITKTVITQSEFDNMIPEKKGYVLAHPELFIIQ